MQYDIDELRALRNDEFYYFLWLSTNVLILWYLFKENLYVFISMLVIYAISICIAVSSIGERILRYMNGARRIATQKEKDRLLWLFDEVCTEARAKKQKISEKIQLYIIDSMTINAYTLGAKSVCVTKGAMQVFTDDELKGVIAHEMGHVICKDYLSMRINYVGNGIFSLLVLIERAIFRVLEKVSDMFNASGANGIINFAKAIFDMIVFVLLSCSQIIFAIQSRKNEYSADKMAYILGYGEELKRMLYIMQDVEITGSTKVIEKMKRSHPELAYRIEVLEQLQMAETENVA